MLESFTSTNCVYSSNPNMGCLNVIIFLLSQGFQNPASLSSAYPLSHPIKILVSFHTAHFVTAALHFRPDWRWAAVWDLHIFISTFGILFHIYAELARHIPGRRLPAPRIKRKLGRRKVNGQISGLPGNIRTY